MNLACSQGYFQSAETAISQFNQRLPFIFGISFIFFILLNFFFALFIFQFISELDMITQVSEVPGSLTKWRLTVPLSVSVGCSLVRDG